MGADIILGIVLSLIASAMLWILRALWRWVFRRKPKVDTEDRAELREVRGEYDQVGVPLVPDLPKEIPPPRKRKGDHTRDAQADLVALQFDTSCDTVGAIQSLRKVRAYQTEMRGRVYAATPAEEITEAMASDDVFYIEYEPARRGHLIVNRSRETFFRVGDRAYADLSAEAIEWLDSGAAN